MDLYYNASSLLFTAIDSYHLSPDVLVEALTYNMDVFGVRQVKCITRMKFWSSGTRVPKKRKGPQEWMDVHKEKLDVVTQSKGVYKV